MYNTYGRPVNRCSRNNVCDVNVHVKKTQHTQTNTQIFICFLYAVGVKIFLRQGLLHPLGPCFYKGNSQPHLKTPHPHVCPKPVVVCDPTNHPTMTDTDLAPDTSSPDSGATGPAALPNHPNTIGLTELWEIMASADVSTLAQQIHDQRGPSPFETVSQRQFEQQRQQQLHRLRMDPRSALAAAAAVSHPAHVVPSAAVPHMWPPRVSYNPFAPHPERSPFHYIPHAHLHYPPHHTLPTSAPDGPPTMAAGGVYYQAVASGSSPFADPAAAAAAMHRGLLVAPPPHQLQLRHLQQHNAASGVITQSGAKRKLPSVGSNHRHQRLLSLIHI